MSVDVSVKVSIEVSVEALAQKAHCCIPVPAFPFLPMVGGHVKVGRVWYLR